MECECKNDLYKKAINTARLLAADGVQAANSGHPGMPMGGADFAFTLWNEFLRFDPQDLNWIGRDRFVLSAGHGSMLIYTMLHMFNCGLSIDDLKQFRQLNSKTPGHPEFGHTPGVEITTGPLASGMASAVGMAIGLKQLKARLGNPACFNQKVYVMSGDGCFMEGTCHEACALAGHLKLDNLVLYYDSNSITIEGATSLAMSEDVAARFRAYGWEVVNIYGHCAKQIRGALAIASTASKPTLIIGTSTIGKGSPNKAGTSDCHGSPLGAEELAATKVNLGFNPEESFAVPADVRQLCNDTAKAKHEEAQKWNECFKSFQDAAPAETKSLLDALVNKKVPGNLLEELLKAVPAKATASRNSSGEILQKVAALVPALVGGSADLNPSTKTFMKGCGAFSADDRSGRNIYYGIRELAMGLINNGLATTYTIPLSSTFMVFSDYMKPAIRLAALMNLHEVYVFTHDSFHVGEDGPTHQPIDQLAMLRSIPGLTVIRPAESNEVAHAWAAAMQVNGPVALVLTRQNLQNFSAEMAAKIDLKKGAYVVSEDAGFDAIIIATGSEVGLALEAAEILRGQGKKLRVVSMPSWELFEAQSKEYKAAILPANITKRISVEAGSSFGWAKFTGLDGLNISLDHFGASAPSGKLAELFGFTGAAVAEKVKAYLG